MTAGDGLFKTQGKVLKFDGYRRALPPAGKQEDQLLPNLSVGQVLDLHALEPTQHFTQPPPRFSEATLIKALEKENIGRPSTYAPIISTIQTRGYVELKERRFFATDLGMLVTDQLVEHFPKILDLKFTAQMEDELDDIAPAKEDMIKVLDDFYHPFQEALKLAETQMQRVSVPSIGSLPGLRRADGREIQQIRPVSRLLEVSRLQGDPPHGRLRTRRGRRDRAQMHQVRQAAYAPREQARAVPVVLGLSRAARSRTTSIRTAIPCPRSWRPSTFARSAASRWRCGKVRGARSSAARAIPNAGTPCRWTTRGKPVADREGRRQVREVRRPDGRQARPSRAVPRLPELSQMPEHRADSRRAQGAARRPRSPPPAPLRPART